MTFSTSVLTPRVEHLPSLVDAARREREPSWRALDESTQSKGTQGHGTPAKWGEGCRCPKCTQRQRERQAAALQRQGLSEQRIAETLKVSRYTVRCALNAELAEQQRRAIQEMSDAQAVRGGGKTCPCRVHSRGAR